MLLAYSWTDSSLVIYLHHFDYMTNNPGLVVVGKRDCMLSLDKILLRASFSISF